MMLCLAPLLSAAAAAAPLGAQGHEGHAGHAEHAPGRRAAGAPPDSAYAAMQRRGERAMGVDQYTSAHHFEALPDGGRIVLQREVEGDSAGVAAIRAHLRAVAASFAAGDFTTPAFVHARDVPGTAVMAAKRRAIAYAFRELPRGGEVRIMTRDPAAVRAVHEFLAFQRREHRVKAEKGKG
jgi:hypothetical protein